MSTIYSVCRSALLSEECWKLFEHQKSAMTPDQHLRSTYHGQSGLQLCYDEISPNLKILGCLSPSGLKRAVVGSFLFLTKLARFKNSRIFPLAQQVTVYSVTFYIFWSVVRNHCCVSVRQLAVSTTIPKQLLCLVANSVEKVTKRRGNISSEMLYSDFICRRRQRHKS